MFILVLLRPTPCWVININQSTLLPFPQEETLLESELLELQKTFERIGALNKKRLPDRFTDEELEQLKIQLLRLFPHRLSPDISLPQVLEFILKEIQPTRLEKTVGWQDRPGFKRRLQYALREIDPQMIAISGGNGITNEEEDFEENFEKEIEEAKKEEEGLRKQREWILVVFRKYFESQQPQTLLWKLWSHHVYKIRKEHSLETSGEFKRGPSHYFLITAS